MHTQVIRQAPGACVETVTEDTGLSRIPTVMIHAPETFPRRVVAGGKIKYTDSPIKVKFKYFSFSPIRQAYTLCGSLIFFYIGMLFQY